jgi:hypothetical protein
MHLNYEKRIPTESHRTSVPVSAPVSEIHRDQANPALIWVELEDMITRHTGANRTLSGSAEIPKTVTKFKIYARFATLETVNSEGADSMAPLTKSKKMDSRD